MIVIVVGVLLVWSFYKTLTGKGSGCGPCGGCEKQDCDLRKEEDSDTRH